MAPYDVYYNWFQEGIEGMFDGMPSELNFDIQPSEADLAAGDPDSWAQHPDPEKDKSVRRQNMEQWRKERELRRRR